jgi:hypothetical protein
VITARTQQQRVSLLQRQWEFLVERYWALQVADIDCKPVFLLPTVLILEAAQSQLRLIAVGSCLKCTRSSMFMISDKNA